MKMDKKQELQNGRATKGSQRDIQWLFNVPQNRKLLESKLKMQIVNDVGWISPIKQTMYKEYRDKDFMVQIGLGSRAKELVGKFWPNKGPVWDGLAKSVDDTILLFEAKAHISELFGIGMKATARESREKALQALFETANYIGADYDPTAWTDAMYQTANRLAHLYFLNKIIGHRAKLIYLIFLNDDTVPSDGETKDMWNMAIDIAERYILKLPKKKTTFSDGSNGSWHDWVDHVFIDMKEMMPLE